MRRRDRFTHAVWLSKFEDQEADGRQALPGSAYLKSIGDMLHQLCRMGYVVEIQLDHDQYAVRCWATTGRMAIGLPPVSLSYSGTDLRLILASSTLEAAKLSRLEHRYVVATKEVVRWVS